jgi:hypothetical protein
VVESDRRIAPRLPSSLKIVCYPLGGGLMERRQSRVRNVSRSGIGLVVDRPWKPGTTLVLELPGEETTRTVRARVIHATPQMGGTILVGCALEQPLTDAEVGVLAR